MNIILTSACNKNCSFCFAKDYITNPKKEIFELDFVKNLILEAAEIQFHGATKFKNFRLLGGEPTKYPHFKELMKWLINLANERIKDKTPMTEPQLISNFLFTDSEIGDLLLQYYKTNSKFNLLLNSSEFASEKQFDLFIDNINKYTVFQNNVSVALGFTMFHDNDFEFYEKTLDRLYDEYISKNTLKSHLPQIRLSMPNPEHGSIDFDSILEKTDQYRDLMKKFISWSKDHDIKLQFDCGLFYCLFDDELKTYVNNWALGGDNLGCNSSAYDIFPNGDIINCYPANGLLKSNYYKYNSFLPAMNEISIKHRLLRSQTELLPEVCQKCKYLRKECNGPCLGYFKSPDKKFDGVFNT